MAIDLRARLSLDGNQFLNSMRRIERMTQQATRQTNLWRDSQGRLRDDLGRFARQSNNVSNSMHSMGKALTSPIRAIGNLTSGLSGLVGAYAAVSGAKKVFESTIGEAAKYEQSTVMISAMLNDEKLGKDYMKLVDKFAVDSPILDSQGMLGNSKSFLTASKDMKQLEKMWSLAERMAAIDPYQGLEGAVFSLRELFAGDAISIVRRFEMPKDVMNGIKKMELNDQLKELDKYFNSIGMTQKLIEEMGGTTLGVWAQIKEASNVVLRSMGQPALLKIREFLKEMRTGMASVSDIIADRNLFTPEEFRERMNRAMQFEKFQETGKKILENISTGFINSVKGIGRWMESIQQNGEFQKQTTLFGKVKWVIEDVYENFTNWLDGGGRDKIAKTASDMIQILTASVEASMNSIIPIGVKIGSGIFEGISSGLKSQLDESWIAQLLADPLGFVIKKATFGKVDPLKDHRDAVKALEEKERLGKAQGPLQHSKRNGGLSRVPYNGATYSLHKDEMVLPRGEAAAYRNGNLGGGVVISGNTFHVRQESDIQKIAQELAKLIEMEGAQMA